MRLARVFCATCDEEGLHQSVKDGMECIHCKTFIAYRDIGKGHWGQFTVAKATEFPKDVKKSRNKYRRYET